VRVKFVPHDDQCVVDHGQPPSGRAGFHSDEVRLPS
jgi:hypothetical protein